VAEAGGGTAAENGVAAGQKPTTQGGPGDAVRKPRATGESGTADVAVDWFWPGTDVRTATVTLRASDLDLAAWTAAAPGGPVSGRARLEVRYTRPARGEPRATVHLSAEHGTVRGKTLGWLAALPGPIAGWTEEARPEEVRFDRLEARLEVRGKAARFVAPGREETSASSQAPGTLPGRRAVVLLAVHLLGREVPLLWAGEAPFEARAFWEALRQGLAAGPAGERSVAPTAVARRP